jgi:hypothetical protein
VLDADDAWRPERLERMLAAAARTQAELVADNQIFFDGKLQEEVGVALPLATDIDPLTVEILFANEREDSAMGLGLIKPLIARRVILDRGIRYDETLRYTEDLHFYARLLIAGVRGAVLAEAYYLYTNPIGFLSGERSRHSRTKTSTESRLRIADDLIGRFADRLSPQAKAEILAFRKRAEQRIAIQKITALRLTRDYGRLTLFLAAIPARPGGTSFRRARFTDSCHPGAGTERPVSLASRRSVDRKRVEASGAPRAARPWRLSAWSGCRLPRSETPSCRRCRDWKCRGPGNRSRRLRPTAWRSCG